MKDNRMSYVDFLTKKEVRKETKKAKKALNEKKKKDFKRAEKEAQNEMNFYIWK